MLSNWLNQFPDKKLPLLMAHRGNRARFPENTMAAFRQAIVDGADILETDLHLSQDGEFVCIHDAAVDRTMDGSGGVASMTLAALKRLHALDKDSRATAESIPALDELAGYLPADAALALELKTDRFLEEDVCRMLGGVLADNHILNRTILLSFSMERLKTAKRVMGDIPIGWISMTRLVPNLPVDLIGSFWPAFYFNPFYVKMAHRHGILTCPLDPTPDRRLPYYLRLGVDAILSDDPAATRSEMDRLQD